jgi:hypothetical protein
MSSHDELRQRRVQLFDKLSKGEIDRTTYEFLVSELDRLDVDVSRRRGPYLAAAGIAVGGCILLFVACVLAFVLRTIDHSDGASEVSAASRTAQRAADRPAGNLEETQTPAGNATSVPDGSAIELRPDATQPGSAAKETAPSASSTVLPDGSFPSRRIGLPVSHAPFVSQRGRCGGSRTAEGAP